VNILLTGGAGFIGSHVLRRLVSNYPDYTIVNLDALTYAGNLENLKDIENKANYVFARGDISDFDTVHRLFEKFQFQKIVHLAAESHVDRSIEDPMSFVRTNLLGTTVLLNCARKLWNGNFENKLFYHISTDEVYGSLELDDSLFTEKTPYDPRSPYSASKAGSDHLVRSFYHTYKMPVVISNCSNNYGPNQFPEKLIPLMINNILEGKSLPVYGRGVNVRDWLYVEDHAEAIELILHKGKPGETYNIGGWNEWRNIDLVELLCDKMDEKLGNTPGESRKLITFVNDRAGHDLRYAIDASKIAEELGWKPRESFETGIVKTIEWYLSHQEWLGHIRSGAYRKYSSTHTTP
jgi:dTDP-glucose 4,6-dehydratase